MTTLACQSSSFSEGVGLQPLLLLPRAASVHAGRGEEACRSSATQACRCLGLRSPSFSRYSRGMGAQLLLLRLPRAPVPAGRGKASGCSATQAAAVAPVRVRCSGPRWGSGRRGLEPPGGEERGSCCPPYWATSAGEHDRRRGGSPFLAASTGGLDRRRCRTTSTIIEAAAAAVSSHHGWARGKRAA